MSTTEEITTELDESTLPWQQQENESDEYFKMFEHYLVMRAHRNYKDVAFFFNTSTRRVATIGKKWQWVRRADLYEMYIRDNIKFQYLDYLQNYEKEKFESKINYSVHLIGLIEHFKSYIENFYKLYDNKEAIKKIKYIKHLTSTLNHMYKMADFMPNPKLSNVKILRDIDLSKYAMPLKGLSDKEKKYIISNAQNINILMKSEQVEVSDNPENHEPNIPDSNIDINKFLTDLRAQDEEI